MSTWRELIAKEMADYGETWDDVVATALGKARSYCDERDDLVEYQVELDHQANDEHPLTVWTKRRVYFPVCYDSRVWVRSASREPDGEPMIAVGG